MSIRRGLTFRHGQRSDDGTGREHRVLDDDDAVVTNAVQGVVAPEGLVAVDYLDPSSNVGILVNDRPPIPAGPIPTGMRAVAWAGGASSS